MCLGFLMTSVLEFCDLVIDKRESFNGLMTEIVAIGVLISVRSECKI
jgi:hypothetical protein